MRRLTERLAIPALLAMLSIGLAAGCSGGQQGIDEGIDADDGMGPVGSPYDLEGAIEADSYAGPEDLGPPAEVTSPVDPAAPEAGSAPAPTP